MFNQKEIVSIEPFEAKASKVPENCLIDGKGQSEDSQIDLSPHYFTSSTSLTKVFPRLKHTNSQLQSNSILLDFINPLYKGNFTLLTGKSNHGKTKLLHSISSNFTKTQSNSLFYLSFDKNKAKRVFNATGGRGTVLCPSSTASAVEIYRLPFILLSLVKEALNQGKRDILVVVDDFTTHFTAERQLYDAAGQAASPDCPFAALRDLTGTYEDYRLSFLTVYQENSASTEAQIAAKTKLEHIRSFTDRILNFQSDVKFLNRVAVIRLQYAPRVKFPSQTKSESALQLRSRPY